jgi:hypothetical protein
MRKLILGSLIVLFVLLVSYAQLSADSKRYSCTAEALADIKENALAMFQNANYVKVATRLNNSGIVGMFIKAHQEDFVPQYALCVIYPPTNTLLFFVVWIEGKLYFFKADQSNAGKATEDWASQDDPDTYNAVAEMFGEEFGLAVSKYCL